MARSRKRRAKLSLLDQLAAERAERKRAARAQRQEQERGFYAADLRKRAEALLRVENMLARALPMARELEEMATRYRLLAKEVTSVGANIRQGLWSFVRGDPHQERDRAALGDQVGTLLTAHEIALLFDRTQAQPDVAQLIATRAQQMREHARTFLTQTRPERPYQAKEKIA